VVAPLCCGRGFLLPRVLVVLVVLVLAGIKKTRISAGLSRWVDNPATLSL